MWALLRLDGGTHRYETGIATCTYCWAPTHGGDHQASHSTTKMELLRLRSRARRSGSAEALPFRHIRIEARRQSPMLRARRAAIPPRLITDSPSEGTPPQVWNALTDASVLGRGGKRMVFYAYTSERQLKIVYHPVTTGRDWFRKGNSTDLLFGSSSF